MAVENIGNLVPTKIPALVDDANIQDALRAYHYGSYDFDTAENDPAELLVPSMAISSAQNSAPVAANFSAFSATIPNGYIWVDKDASAPVGYLSATSLYTATQPTTGLANGVIWIKKGSSPIEMYVYNGDTSSFDQVI